MASDSQFPSLSTSNECSLSAQRLGLWQSPRAAGEVVSVATDRRLWLHAEGRARAVPERAARTTRGNAYKVPLEDTHIARGPAPSPSSRSARMRSGDSAALSTVRDHVAG